MTINGKKPSNLWIKTQWIYQPANSLKQTYKNFEYIIVSDGSTDNTEQIVKSFKDKRIRFFKKWVVCKWDMYKNWMKIKIFEPIALLAKIK